MERSMRAVAVGGQQLRVAVRPGDGTRPPLVLATGIGASLEVLQPFVDHLDPAIEVIRFDVPGVGGRPYRGSPTGCPGWPGWSPGSSTSSATSASTCWGSPGVVAWPSSSPCRSATAAGGWSWPPPAPAH
jgi:pimeloyl-ACP methyl ester carboxylesterase